MHCKNSRNVVLFTMILFIKSQAVLHIFTVLTIENKVQQTITVILFTLLEVINQTLEIVLHREIQTPRIELKI